MKKKITFWRFLVNWFIVALILGLINVFFIKSTIVHSLILASLGIVLLIKPIYPANLENKYTAKQCSLFIRTVAVIEILLAFATRTAFHNDTAVYSTTVISTYSYRPEAILELGIIVVIVIVSIIGIIVWRKKRK